MAWAISDTYSCKFMGGDVKVGSLSPKRMSEETILTKYKAFFLFKETCVLAHMGCLICLC